jgi:hypothetical protein
LFSEKIKGYKIKTDDLAFCCTGLKMSINGGLFRDQKPGKAEMICLSSDLLADKAAINFSYV